MRHVLGNHQAGALKIRDAEGVPHYVSFGWIEAHPKTLKEAATAGKEIKRLPIGGPPWLVIPMLAIGDANPCPAASQASRRVWIQNEWLASCGLKGYPSPVRREVWLEEISDCTASLERRA